MGGRRGTTAVGRRAWDGARLDGESRGDDGPLRRGEIRDRRAMLTAPTCWRSTGARMPDVERAAARTVLVDTNVILDLVLAREPWAADAARLLSDVERGTVRGWMASHAVTTVHYVVAKY